MIYTEEQRLAHQRLREETALIHDCSALAVRCLSDISTSPGASKEAIHAAEDCMQIKFPEELKRFWAESNGIDWLGAPLVMSVETMIEENRGYRSGDLCDFYMSFDSLLVFGRTGLGDLFFYPIQWNGQVREDIFHLDHQMDSRVYFADSLRELFISLAIGKY